MRAEALEQAFRVYFADPNVHAIMLWGFADQYTPFADDYCLTEGPQFKVTNRRAFRIVRRQVRQSARNSARNRGPRRPRSCCILGMVSEFCVRVCVCE